MSIKIKLFLALGLFAVMSGSVFAANEVLLGDMFGQGGGSYGTYANVIDAGVTDFDLEQDPVGTGYCPFDVLSVCFAGDLAGGEECIYPVVVDGTCLGSTAPAEEFSAVARVETSAVDGSETVSFEGFVWNSNVGFVSMSCGVSGEYVERLSRFSPEFKTGMAQRKSCASADGEVYGVTAEIDPSDVSENRMLLKGKAYNKGFGYIYFEDIGCGESVIANKVDRVEVETVVDGLMTLLVADEWVLDGKACTDAQNYLDFTGVRFYKPIIKKYPISIEVDADYEAGLESEDVRVADGEDAYNIYLRFLDKEGNYSSEAKGLYDLDLTFYWEDTMKLDQALDLSTPQADFSQVERPVDSGGAVKYKPIEVLDVQTDALFEEVADGEYRLTEGVASYAPSSSYNVSELAELLDKGQLGYFLNETPVLPEGEGGDWAVFDNSLKLLKVHYVISPIDEDAIWNIPMEDDLYVQPYVDAGDPGMQEQYRGQAFDFFFKPAFILKDLYQQSARGPLDTIEAIRDVPTVINYRVLPNDQSDGEANQIMRNQHKINSSSLLLKLVQPDGDEGEDCLSEIADVELLPFTPECAAGDLECLAGTSWLAGESECEDLYDNDGDGRIDEEDLGCIDGVTEWDVVEVPEEAGSLFKMVFTHLESGLTRPKYALLGVSSDAAFCAKIGLEEEGGCPPNIYSGMSYDQILFDGEGEVESMIELAENTEGSSLLMTALFFASEALLGELNDNQLKACEYSDAPAIYSLIEYIFEGKRVRYFSNKLPRGEGSCIANPNVKVLGNIYSQVASSTDLDVPTYMTTTDVSLNVVRNVVYENIKSSFREWNVGADVEKSSCTIRNLEDLDDGLDLGESSCSAYCEEFIIGDEQGLYCKDADLYLKLNVLGEGTPDIIRWESDLNSWDGNTWNGKRILVVDGGNLYIESNLYNTDSGRKLSIATLRSPDHAYGESGNVYVHYDDVRNIQASVVADGSIFTWLGKDAELQLNPESGEYDDLQAFYSGSDFRNGSQLLWRGSISSKNTIGGGGSARTLASGVQILGTGEKSDNMERAMFYDFNSFRVFNLCTTPDLKCARGLRCPSGKDDKDSSNYDSLPFYLNYQQSESTLFRRSKY